MIDTINLKRFINQNRNNKLIILAIEYYVFKQQIQNILEQVLITNVYLMDLMVKMVELYDMYIRFNII